VLIQLWIGPSGRVLSANDDDHGFFLFVIAHGERVLFHGANPLLSDRLNVPDGVNMMANTSVLALSLPFAPVTHFFGAGVAVAAAHRWACPAPPRPGTGCCPGIWSQPGRGLDRRAVVRVRAGDGVARERARELRQPVRGAVHRLAGAAAARARPDRARRVALGLLIVLQVFINEETLLFTALTLGVFVLAYAAMAPRRRVPRRRLRRRLGVGGAVAGVLLAYPLWFQFAGPGSYHGQPFLPDKYVDRPAVLGAYARQSLAGNGAVARALSVSATEDNTFFGLPPADDRWCRGGAAVAVGRGPRRGDRRLVLLVVSMGPRCGSAATTPAYRCRSAWSATCRSSTWSA
jgi:hypothetical protein